MARVGRTVTTHQRVATSEKCARLYTFDCARVPVLTGLSPAALPNPPTGSSGDGGTETGVDVKSRAVVNLNKSAFYTQSPWKFNTHTISRLTATLLTCKVRRQVSKQTKLSLRDLLHIKKKTKHRHPPIVTLAMQL